MGEYLHIRYCYDIPTIVSLIFWHLHEHVTKCFNMYVIVSIETKLYVRNTHLQHIIFFLCVHYCTCLVCIGGSLINFPQHVIHCNITSINWSPIEFQVFMHAIIWYKTVDNVPNEDPICFCSMASNINCKFMTIKLVSLVLPYQFGRWKYCVCRKRLIQIFCMKHPF